MPRALLACLPLCLLLFGAPSLVRADGIYVEEGVGIGTVGDQLGEIYQGGPVVRFALGARVENYSGGVFLSVAGLDKKGTGQTTGQGEIATLLRYGPELRYLVPLRKNLRLYMRGGLSQNHLTGTGTEMRGRGVEWGTGAMYSTKVRALGFLFWPAFFTKLGPKVSASVWADGGGHFARLRDERDNTLDVRTATWSLGFTIGGDL